MSQTITAIFENGVFKPLGEVKVKEHKKVTIILDNEDEYQEGISLSGIIDIAKDCPDTDLSIHHDKYLYGGVTG